MLLPRIVIGMFFLAATVFASVVLGQSTSIGSGQAYPNKPVRIVTSAAGGSGDFTSRLIALGLTDSLGQPVIVDNRGSGSLIGAIVSKAAPDGYTLLVTGDSLWIGPFLQKMSYDPVRDFLPITLTTTAPGILVVYPAVPAKSVQELIAYAKARPGELNYVSSGTAVPSHLAGELFKAMAHVDIVRVNYKGAGIALNDLLAGQAQMMFATAGLVAAHIKSGRLRALAGTSARPSALFPGLPTIAASGLPGYDSGQTIATLAPAKTPAAIIKRLNQEVVRVLYRPDVKQKFNDAGAEIVGSTPGQLAAKIRADMTIMGKVIKDAGIKAE